MLSSRAIIDLHQQRQSPASPEYLLAESDQLDQCGARQGCAHHLWGVIFAQQDRVNSLFCIFKLSDTFPQFVGSMVIDGEQVIPGHPE